MANKPKYYLRIPTAHRSFVHPSELDVALNDVDIWKEAASVLSVPHYRSPKTTQNIFFDWRPRVRRERRSYSLDIKFKEAGWPDGPIDESEFNRLAKQLPKREVRIPVYFDDTSDGKRFDVAESLIRSFVHDVYLIMNLSSPGSCDFFRASLKAAHHPNPYKSNFTTKISLSSYQFEFPFTLDSSKSHAALTMIPLKKTLSWFRKVRPRASQVPSNRIERVMFALLHMAMLDISPVRILWISHAIEALLDTPKTPGQNIKLMKLRSARLLDATTRQEKWINDTIDNLYSRRSGFIHGGQNIFHPMQDEWIDKHVESYVTSTQNTADESFHLVLALLQKIIIDGRAGPKFKEVTTVQVS